MWLDAANENKEDEQDLNAECNAFSGHLRHPLSLEHSGSIFLAVGVVFVCDCDAKKNADDERDNDENCPREEWGPIIERASLQEWEHKEQKEHNECHWNTSFLWVMDI